MPGLDEVLHYLTGIWLLIRHQQDGFRWLDLSWRGLRRSFWAFVWCLPALAVIWASWRLYFLGNMPEGTTAGPGFFAKMLAIDIIGWLFPLVLIAALAGPLGYARHLTTIVTASNWMAVPLAYLTAVPFAVTLIAPSAGAFAGLLLYAVFGASIILQYRIVWMCTAKQGLLAAAITALFVMPPLLVGQSLQKFFGTLPVAL
ncbi:hypothetical protein LXM94_04255 [Rhizobium sp. TRM95111]|uniref:hypothetical protein n=1 Tax=Rhizobium alarense TaxID=2846851 RepID=UPI001F1E404F|nr:hypothetical protein [Rhizobium alarense]MCF3639172.1 hypothetical protein [Rhizobium alarense]